MSWTLGMAMDAMERLVGEQKAEIRRLRGEEIGKFRPVVSIGIDKNGEVDFRVNMSIAELDRPAMDKLCQMMPWAIKEALSLWLDHGPPSKEMAQQACEGGVDGRGSSSQ